MDLNFLWQPWQDGTNLDDFLADASGRPGAQRLRIAVAWGKRSGLSRVRPHFDAWRAAGGTIHLILGLSEGGATRQGLEEALASADSVHLFHDVSGRTFHPKVYLAETTDDALLLVGSHNLTAGGVYYNYEAGLSITVPSNEQEDDGVIVQVNDWFDRLLADTDCCRELAVATISTLLDNPAYRIGDEDHRRKASPSETDAPEEGDAFTPNGDDEPAPFFRRSQSAKKKNRHDPAGASQPAAATTASAVPAAVPPTAPAATPAAAPIPRTPVMRWSKLLKGTDAQQPPGQRTSPTYNLRLAQARHPIDITTYFRDDFFDMTPWLQDPANADVEYTLIDMEVSVYGIVRDTYEFRVDHNPERIEDQGNVPTVLKWGPLSDYMRNNNHVDDWVLLEKYDDDTYALKIEAADPGTR